MFETVASATIARGWLAAIAVLAVAGCSGASGASGAADKPVPVSAGAQSQSQKQIVEGAKQVAEGAKQVARGVQQLAQAAATPVDFETLKALLPELDGWKRVSAAGEMISLPVPYAVAHGRYAKEASTIDLDITDTALSQVLLGPASMFMSAGFEERSSDGYKKALTIRGAPGYEDWNIAAKTADLTVIVANRFVVRAKGRELGKIDPVRAVMQAVNFGQLGKLK